MKLCRLLFLLIALSVTACRTVTSSFPTQTSLPAEASGLTVKSFTVSPNPVERGATLTLNWDVPGAVSVTLQAVRKPTGSHGDLWVSSVNEQFGLPKTSRSAMGQATVSVPKYARAYEYRFEIEATDAAGAKTTVSSDPVTIICHPPISPYGDCPFPAEVVQAFYQPFEHGHLIWQADTQQIYVLLLCDGANGCDGGGVDGSWGWKWYRESSIDLSETIPSPPSGLYAPAERFAGLWSSGREIWTRYDNGTPRAKYRAWNSVLGWATAPEQSYTMTWQLDLWTVWGPSDNGLFLSFPDKSIVRLVLMSTDDTDGPAWWFDNWWLTPSPLPPV